MLKVVAALIENNDNVLIAKRKKGDENIVGKWEFPGGKVEVNENEKSAIEREIYEEFEIKIVANKFLVNNIYTYPNKEIDLRLYSCTYVSGELKLNDHLEYKWVNKNEILDFDLCEADIKLAQYVKEIY